MNSKDILNLQKAYLGIYVEAIDSEGRYYRDSSTSQEEQKKAAEERRKQAIANRSPGHIPPLNAADPTYMRERERRQQIRAAQSELQRTNPEEAERRKIAAAEKRKKLAQTLLSQPKTEEVDSYDIILSHLLDEGYAETPEAAEKIMIYMSEEWKESIIG